MAMEIDDTICEAQGLLFEIPELTDEQIREMPIEELLQMVMVINCQSMANGRKIVSYSLKMSERIQKELVNRQVNLTKDMTGIAFQVCEATSQAFGGPDNQKMLAVSSLFGGAKGVAMNTVEAHKLPINGQMSILQAQINGNTNIEQTLNSNVDKANNELKKLDESKQQTIQSLIR